KKAISQCMEEAKLTDLLDLKAKHKVESWIEGRKVSDSTKKRQTAYFKSLGDTAVKSWEHLLTKNPFANLEAEAPALVVPEVFTVAECRNLASDKALAHEWGLIGATLLYTGMRLMEAVHLHWDRIYLEDHQRYADVVPPTKAEHAEGARVKRGKHRTVPLPQELVEILARTPLEQRKGYLFPNEARLRSRKWHWAKFQGWCSAVAVAIEGRHPHSLRHTRACIGLAGGESDLTLRLALGHADNDMSAWYAQSAMRLKAELNHWKGEIRLRDPLHISRNSIGEKRGISINQDRALA
ncbi:MAG: tyrosine-type recombinase/integrase, partial [Bdellovibrionia bacterium]